MRDIGNEQLLGPDNFVVGILGHPDEFMPSTYVVGATQLCATLGLVVCVVDSFLGRHVAHAATARTSRLVIFSEGEQRTDTVINCSFRALRGNHPSDALLRCIDRQSPSEIQAVMDWTAVHACNAVVILGQCERNQTIARNCYSEEVPLHRKGTPIEFFRFVSDVHKAWASARAAAEVATISISPEPVRLT